MRTTNYVVYFKQLLLSVYYDKILICSKVWVKSHGIYFKGLLGTSLFTNKDMPKRCKTPSPFARPSRCDLDR